MPRHIKTAALAGQQEEADAKTRQAVEDWRYWVERGYEL